MTTRIKDYWLSLIGMVLGIAVPVGLLYMMLAYGLFAAQTFTADRRIVLPAPITPIPQDRAARIVLLGTSLTARGIWPETLAANLSTCRPSGVTIRRIAKAGASSEWGLPQLYDLLGANAPKPDIVVIEFMANDSSLYRGMRLSRSVRLHMSMLDALGGTNVFLATMNPAWDRRAWVRPGQNAYQTIYRALSKKRSVGLIDTIDDWRKLSQPDRERLVPDGIHPTVAGMDEITVPAFEAALRPLLCSTTGAAPTGRSQVVPAYSPH